jgi:hypothetical protein
MPRSWLAPHRHLLGKLPDREIARRAGVTQATVTRARTALGIAPRRSLSLRALTRAELLDQVRVRANSMSATQANSTMLGRMCRYQFGSWRHALAAAGIRPQANGERACPPPPKPRALTETMLRGTKSATELERLTGIDRVSIKYRRRQLGIDTNELAAKRSKLESVRPLLGKDPDIQLARRAGVHAATIRSARKALRIQAAPLSSLATKSGLREKLAAMPKSELRDLLAGLKPADAVLLRMRYIKVPQATLAEVGQRLAVTRQAVSLREKRVAKEVLARCR